MSLAHRVAAARKKKGLTQEELADVTGVTVRTIQRIESGETTPRPYTLKAIAAALGTSFEALQSAESIGPAQGVQARQTPALHQQADSAHFFQMLCLSCFSYLVLPYVHFLIPLYLLRKRKEHDPAVLAFAWWVIRTQIYWVIALNFSLLLLLAYNAVRTNYFDARYSISYFIPFIVMYLVNVVIISMAVVKSRRFKFTGDVVAGN